MSNFEYFLDGNTANILGKQRVANRKLLIFQRCQKWLKKYSLEEMHCFVENILKRTRAESFTHNRNRDIEVWEVVQARLKEQIEEEAEKEEAWV